MEGDSSTGKDGQWRKPGEKTRRDGYASTVSDVICVRVCSVSLVSNVYEILIRRLPLLSIDGTRLCYFWMRSGTCPHEAKVLLERDGGLLGETRARGGGWCT